MDCAADQPLSQITALLRHGPPSQRSLRFSGASRRRQSPSGKSEIGSSPPSRRISGHRPPLFSTRETLAVDRPASLRIRYSANRRIGKNTWRMDQPVPRSKVRGNPYDLRGGSFDNNPENLRSSARNRNQPGNRNNNIGFRVCCRPHFVCLFRNRRRSGTPGFFRENQRNGGVASGPIRRANKSKPPAS